MPWNDYQMYDLTYFWSINTDDSAGYVEISFVLNDIRSCIVHEVTTLAVL
jgi:hypothetical protein